MDRGISERLASEDSKTVSSVTWWGLAANGALAVVKFVGGILGNSSAVVADGVHSISDMAGDIAILIGIRIWNKPPDDDHPHGHRRIEIFVTLFIGLLLAGAAVGIVWNAIKGLEIAKPAVPTWMALAAPLVSLVVKEGLFQWHYRVGKRVSSAPLVANAWHHRSDALSSIPALLVVVGMMINEEWAFLDQVGSIVVSVFIFHAAYGIIRPGFEKLVDTAAPEEKLDDIRKTALKLKGVRDVTNLRTRYIGCRDIAVEIHVVVDGALTVREGHEIGENVRKTLHRSLPEVSDVIVHVDPSE